MEKVIVYTVQIIDCSSPALYWYHDSIGKKFDVTREPNNSMFWPADETFVTVMGIHPQMCRSKILIKDCLVESQREVEKDLIGNPQNN